MDAEQRAATAQMWDGGDYPRLATLLRPAAEAVAAALDAAPPGAVLDVAAGTGSVAESVARRGRPVAAVDIAPGLVATGRERTTALGLEVTWTVASMDEPEQIRRPADGYAGVASSFGLIFAPDPVATLTALARTLQPGGLLAVSVWPPDGYIASKSWAMAQTMPEQARAAATAWMRWGDVETVRGWLGDSGFGEPAVREHHLPWRFASATEATDFLFTCSPGHVAARRMASDGGCALRQVVLDHLVDFAGLGSPADPVDLDVGYLVLTARVPGGDDEG